MEIKADFGRGKIEKEKREERLQKKKKKYTVMSFDERGGETGWLKITFGLLSHAFGFLF